MKTDQRFQRSSSSIKSARHFLLTSPTLNHSRQRILQSSAFLPSTAHRRGRGQSRSVRRSALLRGQGAAGAERRCLPHSLRDRERVPLQVVPVPWPAHWPGLQLPPVPSRPLDAARRTVNIPERREAAHRQRRASGNLLRELLRELVSSFCLIAGCYIGMGFIAAGIGRLGWWC